MTKRSNGTVGLAPDAPRLRTGLLVRADGAGQTSPGGQPYDHRFIASTERLASDGGVILVNAWNIPVFMQRPRWIAMHDIMGWSAPVTDIALGRVVDARVETGLPLDQVGPTGRALVEYVRYARTQFAQDVKTLFEDGGLDDVSVRWDPRTEQSRAPYEEEVQRYGEGTYWVCTYAEQLELSAVLLGADSGAQIMRGKVVEAFERVRANGAGKALPAFEQYLREMQLAQRVLVAAREFAGTPMAAAVAAAEVTPAAPARDATGSQLACTDCGEPFPADQDGMGWDGEGDERKPVCRDCMQKREASTQEDTDSNGNDLPPLDASLPTPKVTDLSADKDQSTAAVDRAKGSANDETVAQRIAAWALWGARMTARGVDVSAMQDAMGNLGRTFDALDAVLAAMGPVRQDLDDGFTELRNLMAEAMDPDANVDKQNAGTDPNGDVDQGKQGNGQGDGSDGNNPASGAAAADAQQAAAESDAKKKKQQQDKAAKSTAKADDGAANDGAARTDEGATDDVSGGDGGDGGTETGTDADDAPAIRFDLDALKPAGDAPAYRLDWDSLLEAIKS